jgi:hypothetical protein
MKLLAVLALAAPLWAAQSISLPSGARTSFSFPNTPPYTAVSSLQVEFELSNLTLPASNQDIWTINSMISIYATATSICVYSFDAVKYPDGNTAVCIPMAGRSITRFRFTRDLPKQVVMLEAWEADGANYARAQCAAGAPGSVGCFASPSTPIEALNISGSGFEFGSAGGGLTCRLSWFKITSGTYGYRWTIPTRSGGGDLLNLQFEGSTADTSGNGITITAPAGATYETTATAPPVPQIRVVSGKNWMSTGATVSAQQPVQLSGANSYSRASDEGTLTYFWTQIAGPSILTWDSRTSATPTASNWMATNNLRGSASDYLVQLTVTDSTGASTTGTYHVGAVATDANNVVIMDDPRLTQIVGQHKKWGTSGWEWLDERHQVISDKYGTLLNANTGAYRRFWQDAPEAGTITLTNGSTTVTGSGTNFTSNALCTNGNFLVARFNSGADNGYAYIQSCDSATGMTLQSITPWAEATESGVQFSYLSTTGSDAAFGGWFGNTTSNNFYDQAMAHYALYYRSGITRFRDYGRLLAQSWYQARYGDGSAISGMPPRNIAMDGVVLWAIDTGNLAAVMAKLDEWHNNNQANFIGTSFFPYFDIREWAYATRFYALGALYHPDAARRAVLSGYVASGIERWFTSDIRGPNNEYWDPTYCNSTSIDNCKAVGSVFVTNGDTTVTGTGFDATWCGGETRLLFSTSSTAFDAEVYECSYVNSTTLTLSTPYAGTTGAGNKVVQSGVITGRQTQPFVQAIVARAFDLVHLVTADARLRPQVTNLATFQRVWGYEPQSTGTYYLRSAFRCNTMAVPQPIANCYNDEGGSYDVRRFFGIEVVGMLAQNYLHTPTPDDLAYGDLLIGSLYGMRGWTSVTSTFANSDLQDGGFALSVNRAKDYGFSFGFGFNSNWDAARIGGVAPADVRTLNLLYSLPSNADTAVARVIRPDGSSQDFSCTAGACAINYDARQGSTVLYQMRYSSGADLVAAGELRPLPL